MSLDRQPGRHGAFLVGTEMLNWCGSWRQNLLHYGNKSHTMLCILTCDNIGFYIPMVELGGDDWSLQMFRVLGFSFFI